MFRFYKRVIGEPISHLSLSGRIPGGSKELINSTGYLTAWFSFVTVSIKLYSTIEYGGSLPQTCRAWLWSWTVRQTWVSDKGSEWGSGHMRLQSLAEVPLALDRLTRTKMTPEGCSSKTDRVCSYTGTELQWSCSGEITPVTHDKLTVENKSSLFYTHVIIWAKFTKVRSCSCVLYCHTEHSKYGDRYWQENQYIIDKYI